MVKKKYHHISISWNMYHFSSQLEIHTIGWGLDLYLDRQNLTILLKKFSFLRLVSIVDFVQEKNCEEKWEIIRERDEKFFLNKTII